MLLALHQNMLLMDTDAGVPEFIGPTISNIVFVEDAAITPIDYSVRFDAAGALTFSITAGTLPTGLSLSSAGVLSGTPTTQGTSAGLVITADDGTDTADSNSFSIQIVAAGSGGGAGGVRMYRFGFGFGRGRGR